MLAVKYLSLLFEICKVAFTEYFLPVLQILVDFRVGICFNTIVKQALWGGGEKAQALGLQKSV